MLRQRHPLNNYMGPGQGPGGPGAQQNPYGTIQRQFPRQPIRQQHPSMQGNQVYAFISYIFKFTHIF